MLCCTSVFPVKHKRGSVLGCGKNLPAAGAEAKKIILTFKDLLCDLNGTAWSSDVYALISCLIRGFLTTRIHLPWTFLVASSTLLDPKLSAQTTSQPEDATASLNERSEAMTTSLLTSLMSYPSFQRHRRCFLISSRIPSIHSQKGKFLSFIFS